MLQTVLPYDPAVPILVNHAALVIGSSADVDEPFGLRTSFPDLSPSHAPQGALWILGYKGPGSGTVEVKFHHVDFLEGGSGQLIRGGEIWSNTYSGSSVFSNILFHPNPAVTTAPGAGSVVNTVLPSAFILTVSQAAAPASPFGLTLASC